MKKYFWLFKLVFVLPALILVSGSFVAPVFAATTVTTGGHIESGGTYSMDGNVASDEWVQSRGIEVEAVDGKYDLFDYPNVAYSLAQSISGSGGNNSLFNLPRGIYTDSDGNLLIADTYNNRIQKFDTNGNMLMQFGSLGTGNGQMTRPQGVTTDSVGNIYVADTNNNRIQKFTSAGTHITQWGSAGSGNGQFSSPIGIAVYNGEVFVSDFLNDRIQVFNTNGVFLRTWGSNGTGAGQLYWPRALKMDGGGNIYVAEQANNRVQKFDINGNSLMTINTTGFVNSYGTEFGDVNGLTIDADGNIFITHTGRQQIMKFNSEGEFLLRWGDESNIGTGDYQFNFPYDITSDDYGNIYVADTSNNRIQKFSPSDIPGGDYSQSGYIPGYTCGSLNYRAYSVVNDQRVYGQYMTIIRPECADFAMDMALAEPGLVEGQTASYTFSITNKGGSYDPNDYYGAEMLIIVPDGLELTELTDGSTYECEDFTADALGLPAMAYHLGTAYTCRPLASYGEIEPDTLVSITIEFNVVGPVDNSTTMRAIALGGDIDTDPIYNSMYDSDDDIFVTFEHSNNLAIFSGVVAGDTFISSPDQGDDTPQVDQANPGVAADNGNLASTGQGALAVIAVASLIILASLAVCRRVTA